MEPLKTMSNSDYKETYLAYKEHGVCPQCGVNQAAPHRVRCEECLLKNADSRRKSYESKSNEEKEEKRAKHRKYVKQLRADRKAAGLCIYCEKKQYSKSTTMCIDHFIINKRKNEAKRNGVARVERPLYGMCYRCGTDIKEGSLCEKCLAQSKRNLPKKMNPALYQFHKMGNNAVFGR